MVSERTDNESLEMTRSTAVSCQVSWNGRTVEIEVDASMSYAQLRDAACDFFRLERGRVALLTAQGRYGVRMRDSILVNATVLIARDCVGGSGLEAPPVPLHPWDRKTYRRVVNHLESCTNAGNERLRLFLSWIDYANPLGESLLEAVHCVKRLPSEQVKTGYYAEKDEAFFRTQTDELLRWGAIKCELKKLVPQESALEPLAQLKALEKKPTETLLEFVVRFGRAGKTYIDEKLLSEENVTHLLVQKLPVDFVYHLSTVAINQLTLQFIYDRVCVVMDYIRLRSGEVRPSMKLGDYMDLGSMQTMCNAAVDEDETCRAVRDVIVRDGKLQFPLTLKTKNQIMIAFKELLSEDRYFEESQRAIRAEADRRRTHSSKAKEARHANMDEEEALDRAHLCEVESISRTESPLVCRSVQPKKASMHANLEMAGKSIRALIDTGATDNFLQEETVKALGLASSMLPSDRHVVLANGEREKITGHLDVPAKLDGRPVNFSAYCFKGKGQEAIIGYKFLETNGYLVDCSSKKLIKVGEPEVQCFKAYEPEQKNGCGLAVNPANSQA